MGNHGPDKPRVDTKERGATGAVQEEEQNLPRWTEQGKERRDGTFAPAEAAGGVGTAEAWLIITTTAHKCLSRVRHFIETHSFSPLDLQWTLLSSPCYR